MADNDAIIVGYERKHGVTVGTQRIDQRRLFGSTKRRYDDGAHACPIIGHFIPDHHPLLYL